MHFSETYLWPLPEAYPALNTPSPTSFSPSAQATVPWTGFSLTIAVSWMLLLAFRAPTGEMEGSVELVSANTDQAAELKFFNGIYISTLGLPLAHWAWQASLLGEATPSTK